MQNVKTTLLGWIGGLALILPELADYFRDRPVTVKHLVFGVVYIAFSHMAADAKKEQK